MKSTIPSVLFLLVIACSQVNRGPTSREASDWVVNAQARDLCAEVFRNRMEKALSGVDINGMDSTTLPILVSALPDEERKILVDAVNKAPVGKTQTGEYVYSDRVKLVQAISSGFKTAAICNKGEPESDMYAFSDKLNAFLTVRGVDTEELFRTPWDGNQHVDPLREILVVLALSVRGVD